MKLPVLGTLMTIGSARSLLGVGLLGALGCGKADSGPSSVSNVHGPDARPTIDAKPAAAPSVDGSLLNVEASSPVVDGAPPSVFDAAPPSVPPMVEAGASANWGTTGDPSVPWASPFELGEPGWRQSTQIFCDRRSDGSASFEVWADQRGVFVMRATGCNELAGDYCRGDEGIGLFFNDGTAWTLLARFPMYTDGTNFHMTGFEGRPLILYPAYTSDGGWCEIGFFSQGTTVCSPGAPAAADVFVVNSQLAYALAGPSTVIGEPSNELFSWDGSIWTSRVRFPEQVSSVWADDTTILVTVGYGLYRVQPGTWAVEQVPDVPVGPYGSMWATGPDDIWLAAQAGYIQHWNGAEWTAYATEVTNPGDPNIRDIQGAGGKVFFHSTSVFGVIDSTGAHTLVRSGVVAMHVLSATEVFLTYGGGGDYTDTPCGGGFVVWYDGQTFHQM